MAEFYLSALVSGTLELNNYNNPTCKKYFFKVSLLKCCSLNRHIWDEDVTAGKNMCILTELCEREKSVIVNYGSMLNKN